MAPSDYFSPKAGEGLRYPRVGVLVGEIVQMLRLPMSTFDRGEGVGAKTAQRFFKGEQVSEEARERIVSTILSVLLPDDVAPQLEYGGVSGREHVERTVHASLADYERTASSLNSASFALDPRFAIVPMTRLVALDFGIRWGAYQARRVLAGLEPQDRPAWLVRDAFRDVVDRHRGDTPLDTLCEECEVSQNTMDSWRSGRSAPSRDGNLEILAEALASRSDAPVATVLFELRLAVLGSRLVGLLDERFGPPELAPMLALELFEAFETTARLVRDFLTPTIEARRDVAVQLATLVAFQGGRAPGGEGCCNALANYAARGWNMELAADLSSLSGAWEPRLEHWARVLGSVDAAMEHVKAKEGLSDEVVPRLRDAGISLLLRMGRYDVPAFDPRSHQVFRVRNPPEIAGYSFTGLAADAYSTGDIVSALRYIGIAIERIPENAHFHFTRGALLGDLVARGALHLLDEAIQECEIAFVLDSTQGQPINEIGIIKSNAMLYTEAEEAFARAAETPFCPEWAHHHFTRGNNLLALCRYDDARRCFERCLELEPRHTEAKKRLAAALWKLGKKREARSWAAKARADDGEDPLLNVERWATLHYRKPSE